MKHKGMAIMVTVVMLLAMIPLVAFGTVDTLTLTAPEDPVYLRSSTAEIVPVTFTVNASNSGIADSRVSLMKWKTDTEISYVAKTLHLNRHKSWNGTVNLPVSAGTTEGAYDIKIAVTQGDTYTETFDKKVIIDNTAPTATIKIPPDSEKLVTGVAITISGIASDPNISSDIPGSGVAGVAVLITGPHGYSKTPAVDGTNNWEADWTTPTTPGEYFITASATDKAGNVQGKATSITVQVGDETTDDNNLNEDTEAYKAAPAIAAEILKYNNIAPNAKKEKGAKGEKGINYISEVAKKMGNGGDFSKGEESYDDYYYDVLTYLNQLIPGHDLDDPRAE